jgi:hypothetical protein
MVAPIRAAEVKSTGTVDGAGGSARKPKYLSVFTNGVGKGMHAIYVAPNFDAVVQSNGYALVYPKDKGARIGKPLSLGLNAFYRGSVHTIGRPIASFDNDEGPLMNPATVELTGKLDDDVDFSIAYDFDKTGVALRGSVQDPESLKAKTSFRLYMGVPSYTNFPPETLQVDREARLKGLSFVIRKGQKKFVYPYANGAVFVAPAEKCWIEGPVYGVRKLTFEVKATKAVVMSPWIYTQAPPHNGYTIYMSKKDPKSKSPAERLVLTIQ